MKKLIFLIFISSIFGQKVCKRVAYHNILLTDTTEVLEFPSGDQMQTCPIVINGDGKINVTESINYTGEIPSDPYQ